MSLGVIATIIVGVVQLMATISIIIWTITNKASYKYVDETFVRKDTHDLQFNNVMKAIEELKDKIDKLIEEEHDSHKG